MAIRAIRLDDLPYVYGSFAEGRKEAPGLASMTWRAYKEYVVPKQREVFAHPETRILAAYVPGVARTGAPATATGASYDYGAPAPATIVGWLAYWPRRQVSIVHWVHVRYAITPREGDAPSPLDGQPLRRRDVMTQLFDHAGLGRIAYTFVGGHNKHDRDGLTADERLLPWLRSRGHHPVFQAWEQIR